MRDLIILTPVFNDWDSLCILLAKFNDLAAQNDLCIHMVAVNDGSTLPVPCWDLPTLDHIAALDVITLVRNLGHQRAIAMGIAWLNSRNVDAPVIVMDCDGEDKPEDILRLLAESEQSPGQIIFARRTRRSDGHLFRAFYRFFKNFFYLLTGQRIAFGNFCLIPPGQLCRVAHLQELWNHFAAGIMHSGMPWKAIPIARGKRFAGKSHMNLTALVLHGLSAVSVHIEVVYVRLLFLAFALIVLDALGFLALVYVRYGTTLAIPGWATNVAIGLTVVMVQAVLFLALLSFVILSYRSIKMFIPAVDFNAYLLDIEHVKP